MTDAKNSKAIQQSDGTARAYEAPRLEAIGRAEDASASEIGGSLACSTERCGGACGSGT